MFTFPVLIKKIRESSGLTQKEFAKRLNVSTILISMIESEQKEVSKGFVLKLAEALEVQPSSITPFLFTEQNLHIKDLSSIEKMLVQVGEKMQLYLINVKARKLT